ncbi:F510_1955 family glycosylhydrolase [Streptomyces sp. NPDC004779]
MIKPRLPRAAGRTAATAPAPSQPLRLALALPLVLTLALTACSPAPASAPTPDDPSGRPGSGSALTHIHGLGLHEDTLYVATHEGIHSPGPGGAPVLVGDRRDDFMGFTVAPDGTFLAGGHPAPGSGGPSNLGLVASTDAGRTWTERSLVGEVDFHALDAAPGGPVYGYDSTTGRLRITHDLIAWEDRAALRALDIAVSPTAPDTVVATTETGVARSTDGGRTFTPGAGRVVSYVSWGAADALYGVSPDGVLLRSGDGGTAWTRVGAVPGGAPQALTAVDARRLLVATGDGVYESRDAGRSFVRRMKVTPGEAGGH